MGKSTAFETLVAAACRPAADRESYGVRRAALAAWSRRSPARTAAKVVIYLGSAAGLIWAVLTLDRWPAILACQVLLGLVYAHGLELMHECIHNRMFARKCYNRLFGFVAGIPGLVSFSHYKYQHLHHHKYVGTPEDEELFGYDPTSLRNPLTLAVRALNPLRIPRFFLTVLGMCRNRYPAVFNTPRQRRDALVEHLLLAALFAGMLALTIGLRTNVFVLAWFIPWFAFGEPFHFFIELPEHLGCDRTDANITINTRSYRCSFILRYLFNGNNFHVEHHLFPSVAVHNLAHLNRHLDERLGYTLPSYAAALRAVPHRRRATVCPDPGCVPCPDDGVGLQARAATGARLEGA